MFDTDIADYMLHVAGYDYRDLHSYNERDEEARPAHPASGTARPRSQAAQGPDRPAHRQALAEGPQGDEQAAVEPYFPTLQDALEANQASLAGHGQSNHQLLRPEVLEGALARPQQYYHYTGSLPQAAAALAHGVGQSQAFEDGNKRTAYWLTHHFLHENGLGHIAPSDDEELADHLIGYGEGTHRMEDTAQMFESRLGGENLPPVQGNYDNPLFKRSPDQLQHFRHGLVVESQRVEAALGEQVSEVPEQQWQFEPWTAVHTPHPVTHRNLWTGLPCNCPWHHQTMHLRHRERLAGQNINKILKAPDKAYRTPEGEAFRQALPKVLPEEYESLAPYIAQRWKKGEIRVGASGARRYPVSPMHPEGEEQQPMLYTQGYENNDYSVKPHWDEGLNQPDANVYGAWYPLTSASEYTPGQLPRWHQWYEARGHPTRQGVNVMDPNFSVHEMTRKVAAHQDALEEDRQRARVANHGQTVWTAPPEFGNQYKGWHIKHLTAPQNDAGEYTDPDQALEDEGHAMNHCIGSEEQPYRACANDGRITVYSLRDKKGYPHGTWHYNSDGTLAEMFGHSDSGLTDDYQAMVNHWGDANNMETRHEVGHQEGGGYDDEYQLSDPSTADELVQSYDNPYEEAYEDYDANIGENTEFLPGNPEWNHIANDYLNGGSSNPEYFHKVLGYMNEHRNMAQALQEEFDPEDDRHHEMAQHWNQYCPGGHEIDVPGRVADDVDSYNEGHEYSENREPDWDSIAQDYLHNATSPEYGNYHQHQRRRYIPPGNLPYPSELNKFHQYLNDNSHQDEMQFAMQNNADWEDPNHQNAIQQWNYGMPEHNIYPEPEPTMQWTPPGQFEFEQSPVRHTWEDPTLPIEQRLQWYQNQGQQPWQQPGGGTFARCAILTR